MHGITTPPQFSGQSGSAWADNVTTPNLPGQVLAMAVSAPHVFTLTFKSTVMTLLESRIFLSILRNC